MQDERNFSAESAETKIRQEFLEIARQFLIDGDFNDVDLSKMSDPELGEYVQNKFQENLSEFYESSGIAEKIKACQDDEEALHLIAAESEGTHGWMDMLPKLAQAKPGSGMNCTMSSAMLHKSLEELNYDNVRTVSVRGHHVLLRELEDGSIKLYDPSSKTTTDGKLLGYTRTFSAEHIVDRGDVQEKNNRKGFHFTLDRGEQDMQGGFHDLDEHGRYSKKFYAYDPSIYLDADIAIGNLSCIKRDAEKIGGQEDLPIINSQDYFRGLLIYLKTNNTNDISEENFSEILADNPTAGEKILEDAGKFLKEGGTPPNPFDYLKSHFVNPKENLPTPPLPTDYMEDAKLRHEQAKELVKSCPELKTLDYQKVQKQLDLFNVRPYTD